MSKTGFAKDHLNSFIQRIERLEEEKAALAADIREVYSEAKGSGFDPKIMRKVIALRKMDAADRQEMEAILDLYKSALGMLGDTPLGEAAMRAASTPKKKQPPHDPETGEIIESQAKAVDDATHTDLKGGDEGDRGLSDVARAAEAVSRLDARRSASATSEIRDATSRERPAPYTRRESGATYTDEAVALTRSASVAPMRSDEMEIPDFLRRIPRRQEEFA
jgi:uncharacterized protein (UPF0335 family)